MCIEAREKSRIYLFNHVLRCVFNDHGTVATSSKTKRIFWRVGEKQNNIYTVQVCRRNGIVPLGFIKEKNGKAALELGAGGTQKTAPGGV